MQLSETNELFAWLLTIHPQWKPEKRCVVVWAQELPDVPAAHAISVIRAKRIANPSPFPPSALEVVSWLQPTPAIDPALLAKQAFAALWKKSSGATLAPDEQALLADPAVAAAHRATGDDYGQCQTADRHFHERRFIDLFCARAASQAIDGVAALSAPAYKFLEGGRND